MSCKPVQKRFPFLIALVAIFLVGCGEKTPEPPATLHMIAGVRTAVSAKNPDWLTQWKAKAEQAQQANQVSEGTMASLEEVFKLAESGDWDSANDKIARLQESCTPKK